MSSIKSKYVHFYGLLFGTIIDIAGQSLIFLTLIFLLATNQLQMLIEHYQLLGNVLFKIIRILEF